MEERMRMVKPPFWEVTKLPFIYLFFLDLFINFRGLGEDKGRGAENPQADFLPSVEPNAGSIPGPRDHPPRLNQESDA